MTCIPAFLPYNPCTGPPLASLGYRNGRASALVWVSREGTHLDPISQEYKQTTRRFGLRYPQDLAMPGFSLLHSVFSPGPGLDQHAA